jgi:pilus assembly protein CpaE
MPGRPCTITLDMGETKILLVEDDEPIKRMIGKYLLAQGYKVGLAADGVEAMALVSEQLPDLVLTDVNMPRMNGLELTRRLRSHHRTAQVPIVMLSALRESADMLRGYAEGADEYVPKPIELAVLVAKIETLLRRRAPAEATAKPPGKLTVFMHGKGGVGATTLAVNTGVALAAMPVTSVGLLDLDLDYGDAAILLNLKPTRTLADLTALGDQPIDDELLQTFVTQHASRLSLVVGSERPERAELVTVPAVQRTLERMRGWYDHVVVDLPANFSETTLAAIDAADRACVVVPAGLPGLRGSLNCLDVLTNLGYPAAKIAVVLNRVRPAGLGFDQVAKFLGRVPDVVLTYSEILEECATLGVPVLSAQPDGAAAREIQVLAEFVAGVPVAV